MKKTIFFIFIIIVFSSCSHFKTKQQRAQNLVKLYLDSTLNDPKSYESVKFTPIDSAYSNYNLSEHYLQLKAKSDSVVAAFDEWKEQNPEFNGFGDLSHEKVLYFVKMNRYYSDQNIAILKQIANDGKLFKSKFSGYTIYNEYRAKNGFGALGLHGISFTVDSDITKVISTYTIQ
ncbi:hypothetical protein SAMN05216490_2217 [Mucilaginibacter mallensis]|uniref:Uncharacterized protein n=1 Tax=Mucilaginibacter mallensis TaxID=652787 RepID=A0A1H1WKZ1_MUCMA|nr:hypothetical protein [Mucilaginibacter mallensis]SDS97704.1 hypothetical protein SAMN05216490_2217 [Mucilaginibacter mallensis]